MIIKSIYSRVFIPRINVVDYLLTFTSTYGRETALINGTTGEECSYSDLTGRILAVAGAFYQRGLNKGDVVCVFSKNDINYIPTALGVIKIGGIVSPCNPLGSTDDIVGQVKYAGAKYLITGEETVPTVNAALKSYSGIKEAFIFGPAQAGFESVSSLLSYEGSPAPDVDVDPEQDVCLLPYSSGTTGTPKGVMVTHYNMVALTQSFLCPDWNSYKRGEVILGASPFFHLLGFGLWFVSIGHGTALAFLERFDPQVFLQIFPTYKAKYAWIAPPIMVLMAKHPIVSQYDLSSLKTLFVGAAPLAEEVELEVKKKIPHVTVQQGCGMTEAGGTHLQPPFSVTGSVGKLVSNTEGKIIDIETGKDLSYNEVGEILLRSPMVMKGYLNDPDKTRETIDADGFLHTGDVGYYDEEGNWFIVDRLKELIKYKAYQVAPSELENLLLSHPGVADAAVIGAPDTEAGELPRAYVVTKPEYNLTEHEITEYINGKVAPHKKIRGGVAFVPEIPKAPTGKILRRVLKESLLKSKM